MASYYLWIKAMHLAFMVTWFAGLFYLPRLFIYHVQTDDTASRDRFTTMEKRLFAIMTIGAVLTVVLGLILASINTAAAMTHWFMVKMLGVVGLFVFHHRCWQWIQRLQNSEIMMDTRWLRWFNEIPVLFLFVIIIMAVVKPF